MLKYSFKSKVILIAMCNNHFIYKKNTSQLSQMSCYAFIFLCSTRLVHLESLHEV